MRRCKAGLGIEDLEHKVASRQKEAIALLQSLKQEAVVEPVFWEVFNPATGPLEIVDDNGQRILWLGPNEMLVITASLGGALGNSSHFRCLRERNLVRVI